MVKVLLVCNMDSRYVGKDNLPNINKKTAEIKNLKYKSAHVLDVKGVHGVYDIVVEIKADDKDHIGYLLQKLRDFGGVKSTLTLLYRE